MRTTKIINDGWRFSLGTSEVPANLPSDWQELNLPYTWNGKDGQDGGNDYFRGAGCFVKELKKQDFPSGEEVYLQIDGANSTAKVYFNGKHVCTHHGGYSTFRVKLDDVKENNLLAIVVDNSPNDFVYPQVADFTFYGGIYRDVSLIGVNRKHFDLDYFGAPGIKITPTVCGKDAKVEVQAFCEGKVEFSILADGKEIATKSVSGHNPIAVLDIQDVRLWNGRKDPYLYTMVAKLVCDGEVADEVSARFGCRFFEIDPQRGFLLNGKEYSLRGVSRHQDRPGIGNAISKEDHKEDVDLICEVGANTVRLAHYQHAQYFYDLCDERGLIVWAEIPYISRHMPLGKDNTFSQMRELICQNYNHPCIVVWGLSNEISMGSADKGLVENHRELQKLVRSLDKTRPTTAAVLTACDTGEEYVHVSDVVSYNHYFGWYGGDVHEYGKWFDDFHKKYPNKAIGLSEYGCEALNWHASHPEQGDYTEEYQAYYHEELIKQIAKRPYLWATHVWNMFDFAADARAEGGESGMNHKGLVSFDRKYKKDAFYAYKAWLSSEPVLHICSKRYVDRTEDTTLVKVYSNQPIVELYANGTLVERKEKGEFPFFEFQVKNEGETLLEARAGELRDEAKIRKVDTPNMDYVMKDDHCVINWFEINTPVGYLSINDTIRDILKPFKGKIFAVKTLLSLKKAMSSGKKEEKSDKKKGKGISVMGVNLRDVNKSMINMAMGFTLKRALMMLGGKFTKEQVLKINDDLNKIKKKKQKREKV